MLQSLPISLVQVKCNLTDEINLKRSYKYISWSNLSIYYAWKNVEESYKNNKFKSILNTYLKSMEKRLIILQ